MTNDIYRTALKHIFMLFGARGFVYITALLRYDSAADFESMLYISLIIFFFALVEFTLSRKYSLVLLSVLLKNRRLSLVESILFYTGILDLAFLFFWFFLSSEHDLVTITVDYAKVVIFVTLLTVLSHAVSKAFR
jgi:hypothetical protein